jgi:alpha-L-fucosidase
MMNKLFLHEVGSFRLQQQLVYVCVILVLMSTGFLASAAEEKSKAPDDPAKRSDIIEQSKAEDLDIDGRPKWLHERLEWFKDLKFGFFISWGPCVEWGGPQSWCIVPETEYPWVRPDDWAPWVERNKNLELLRKDYFQLYRQFNPKDYDPDSWAELAEYAGAKYMCFTTKHHDGFCLFDTKTTDFRVTHKDCPLSKSPKADVTKEIFEAFRKRGFGISCYFSKADWSSPNYWKPDVPLRDRNLNYNIEQDPERWAKFVSFTHEQIRELMTNYGPIDILWLDAGWVRPECWSQDIKMAELARMARGLQPKLIVVDPRPSNTFRTSR